MKEANKEKVKQDKIARQKAKAAKSIFKAPESPTSMQLKNTFLLRHNNPSFDAYAVQMKKRNVHMLHKTDSKMSINDSKGEIALMQSISGEDGPSEPAPVNINSLIPQARDGHISVVHDNKLFVMGGDRHNMPFNDLYMIDLDDFFRGK